MKKGKEYKEVAARIFATTLATYYNWNNQDRPIIDLIEKYFTKEELQEFLTTGKINKLENSNTTIAISVINFVHKVETMYTEEGTPNLFYEFLVYYTHHELCFNDWDSNYPWHGLDEIKDFQDTFFKYLIETDASVSDLRITSSFINQLTQSDLLFLNMNIENGFSSLFNFDYNIFETSFLSLYTKSDILDEITFGIKYAFEQKLGSAAKKFDDLSEMINFLINVKREELKASDSITPE